MIALLGKMLKYTLISLLLWTFLTWVYGSPTEVAAAAAATAAEAIAEEGQEEFSIDFNSTIDDSSKPQPRYAQLSFNNKIYTIYFSKLNWYTALEFCSFHNQNMASITSIDDNTQLIRTLKKYGLQQSEPLWLGANDLGHFGQYVWTGNGQPITYFTNWRNGEPNNDCGNEHCIELLNDGQWNDVRCDEKRIFICESRTSSNIYDISI